METTQRPLRPGEGTPQGSRGCATAGPQEQGPQVGDLRRDAPHIPAPSPPRAGPRGRPPSTCSARNVSRGACQGLLAPSRRLAPPAPQPAKTSAGAGTANRAARQEAAGRQTEAAGTQPPPRAAALPPSAGPVLVLTRTPSSPGPRPARGAPPKGSPRPGTSGVPAAGGGRVSKRVCVAGLGTAGDRLSKRVCVVGARTWGRKAQSHHGNPHGCRKGLGLGEGAACKPRLRLCSLGGI